MNKYFCDKCKQELLASEYSSKNGIPIANFKQLQIPERAYLYCNKCLPKVLAYMDGASE
jgi:hypothetical protein